MKGDKAEVIVIEHKLGASEGQDQTKKYASSECLERLKEILVPIFKVREVTRSGICPFIFLALFPDQKPNCKQFTLKTHKDLHQIYLNAHEVGPGAQLVLRHWHELLGRFYAKATFQPDDKFFEKLANNDSLDGSYLFFCAFLEDVVAKLKLRNSHLQLRHTYRASQQGRHYYGAHITNPRWHPPNSEFDLHFEPQFNLLEGTLDLFLHYETNPYMPKAEAEKRMSEKCLKVYREQRTQFAEELKKHKFSQGKWQFRNGWNMIAKAITFVDCGKTVEEVQNELVTLFEAAEAPINFAQERVRR